MDIKYLDDVGTRHLIEKSNDTFIKKEDIVDNCESDNAKSPLSAKQGKHLQTQISNTKSEVDDLADSLESAKEKHNVWYGICNTESDVSNKVISTDNADFELKDGAVIFVRFNNSTKVDITSFNVDNTGVKPVYAASSSEGSVSYVSANTIGYNEVVTFVYNGLYYTRVDGITASTVFYGITRLNDSITSTSTNTAATSNSVRTAYNTAKTAIDGVQAELDTHKGDANNPHGVNATQVGADPSGTASSVVTAHNTDNSAHESIRKSISDLSSQVNTEISEITANKIDVADIVDNLTTNDSSKPLSAAQGVAIKTITDGLESTKAPKMLIVSSDYTGEDGALEVDHSSEEILAHIRAGGYTMYSDIDIGKFPYLWNIANKVYYGGTLPYGDDFLLGIYEISGTSVTSKGFLYSDFVKKTEIEGLLAEIPDVFETKEDASAKLTEAKAYTDELGQGFGQVLQLMYGEDVPEDDNFLSIRDIAHDTIQSLVVTASSTDGVAYTATVPGIASLTAGTSIIIIPNITSTSKAPTLNVNGLGAKPVRRRLSNLVTASQGYSVDWLAVNLPFRLMYDGTYWIVEGHNKPVAADLYGTPAAATKATQDGNGNVITDTYATKAYVEELIGAILNGAS